ncbi:MAG: 4'-phosphopantetheinyl transferase superfamily protein [Nitriliruptoraceae bacterium]
MTGPSVGCDVVSVERMRRLVADRPGARERIFTAPELADAVRGGVDPDDDVAVERLAARFAAKEAARKALRGRGPALLAVAVRTDHDGAPELWVDGRRTALACSLSHDAGVAMAVVVATAETVAELTT